MSSMPKEIEGLLNSKEGKFLLVKGKAGVGKTMFCLELIKEFGGVYVSTIVTAEQLYKDSPGLEESIPKSFVIDATQYTAPSALKVRTDSDIDDSILREILYETSAAESPTKGPIPPLLKEIDSKCEVAQLPFCVIIDSWDSIFSLAAFPKDETCKDFWVKEEVQKLVLNHFRKRHVNLVMVAEGDRETRMDYLVDGIVALTMEKEGGRMLRLLKIKKLRGAEITFPEYVFTLNGGSFKAHRFQERPEDSELKTWKKVTEHKGFFSTGCPDLDRLLGKGIPKGSTIFLELGHAVPNYIWETLIASMTSNFLLNERSVMVVPMGGMDIHNYETEMYAYVGKDRFDNNVRIVERADTMGATEKPYIIPIRFEDITHDLREWQRVYHRLREKTGNPTLEILGVDTQEARYGEDIYKEIISSSAEQAKRDGNVILRMVRPGLDSITQRTRNISDIHLRLITRNGITIIYGEKPVTNMFTIKVEVQDGNRKLVLKPLV